MTRSALERDSFEVWAIAVTPIVPAARTQRISPDPEG